MFFEIKEDIRQKLNINDIIEILTALGSNYPKRHKDVLLFQTVCHHYPKDDMSYKLYYYIDSGIFKCFTGKQDAYDIYGLVLDTLNYRGINISLEESIEYVVNHSTVSIGFGINSNDYSTSKYNWNFIDTYKNAMQKGKIFIHSIKSISKNILEVYENYYHSRWLAEGITKESMDKFNIKYSILDNRIVIPHYDIYDNLIGVRGRSLRESEVTNGYKYMPMTVQGRILSHPTSMNLYGIYRNKKSIRKQRQVVIFESEKSVLKAESFYPSENYTLAISGRRISEQQIKLLLQLDVNRVILAFDKDYVSIHSEAGKKCLRDIRGIAEYLKPYFSVYAMIDFKKLLEEKDSPIDQGKEVFEDMYRNKIRL